MFILRQWRKPEVAVRKQPFLGLETWLSDESKYSVLRIDKVLLKSASSTSFLRKVYIRTYKYGNEASSHGQLAENESCGRQSYMGS